MKWFRELSIDDIDMMEKAHPAILAAKDASEILEEGHEVKVYYRHIACLILS
jgi:hypothetical protein